MTTTRETALNLIVSKRSKSLCGSSTSNRASNNTTNGEFKIAVSCAAEDKLGGVFSRVFIPTGTMLGATSCASSKLPVDSGLDDMVSSTASILSHLKHIREKGAKPNVVAIIRFGQIHYQTTTDIEPNTQLFLAEPHFELSSDDLQGLTSGIGSEILENEGNESKVKKHYKCNNCSMLLDAIDKVQTHQSSCKKVRTWQTRISEQQAQKQAKSDVQKHRQGSPSGPPPAHMSSYRIGVRNNEFYQGSARPFVCHACSKSFTQFRNLCRHKRLHATCRIPLTCKYCQSKFASIGYMAKHIRVCKPDNSMVSEGGSVHSFSNSEAMITDVVQTTFAHTTENHVYGPSWVTASLDGSSTTDLKSAVPFDTVCVESKVQNHDNSRRSGSQYTNQTNSSQKLSSETDHSPNSHETNSSECDRDSIVSSCSQVHSIGNSSSICAEISHRTHSICSDASGETSESNRGVQTSTIPSSSVHGEPIPRQLFQHQHSQFHESEVPTIPTSTASEILTKIEDKSSSDTGANTNSSGMQNLGGTKSTATDSSSGYRTMSIESKDGPVDLSVPIKKPRRHDYSNSGKAMS